MATFKVGQRVRIRVTAHMQPGYEHYRGVETTIREPGKFYDWLLDLPADGGGYCGAMESALEPLTDPKVEEDAWARDKVKDLTKPRPMDPEREERGVPCWPTVAPTATYGDMTLACTKDGVFAYRNGEWTKVRPIAP